jgi:predicted DsbA family dithiol-disulfide isomerase
VRIDIWSDVVCPWCYIGKRRFECALASVPGLDDVEVVHRSFQLDPTRPKGETINRREMLRSKYRLSATQVEDLDARMEQTAAVEGLEYHMTADGVTGNTSEAHQLLHLARQQGIQDAVVERFFRAYFTEGRSLFNEESLVTLGTEAGLDSSDARRVLQEGAFAAAVAADAHEARKLGATGVPFFVIDRRYGVSGAQAREVFADTLRRARVPREAQSLGDIGGAVGGAA